MFDLFKKKSQTHRQCLSSEQLRVVDRLVEEEKARQRDARNAVISTFLTKPEPDHPIPNSHYYCRYGLNVFTEETLDIMYSEILSRSVQYIG